MTDNLAWRLVSEKDIDTLAAIHDAVACRQIFYDIFSFQGMASTTGAPLDLLLDMYLYLYVFCKERELTPLKTSVVLAIMHRVIQRDLFLQSSDHGKQAPWTLPDSFDHFQSLLLQHSVERPPISTGIFNAADVASTVEYVTHSYYRHFNLYQVIFIPQTHVSIVQVCPIGYSWHAND
ncbi:hypothetical protein DYB32_001487 [Aphanomyces invadans]|uniref:Uncharacterized protein n=1 Tax=Aphanomyces invadans TaxID=157072 RepID=A0A418B670_9STRA|nr:hypothetical protein DYB32_001487 [Aphanomyces invadans]